MSNEKLLTYLKKKKKHFLNLYLKKEEKKNFEIYQPKKNFFFQFVLQKGNYRRWVSVWNSNPVKRDYSRVVWCDFIKSQI